MTTIRVKEWFRDKLHDEAMSHHLVLNGTYNTVGEIQMLDHETLRVDQVLAESEKAWKVVLDADTFGGVYKGYTTWIPKSVILSAGERSER